MLVPISGSVWGLRAMQVGALGVLQGVFLREREGGLADGRMGEMAKGAGVCRSSGLGEGAGLGQAGLVLG